MKTRTMRTAALFAALALALAACSAAADDPTTTSGPGVTAPDGTGAVEGSIVISGSSTVEPISARVAEAFDGANPGTATSVEGPGTGDGFARFCAGETDISNASRPIKDEEVAECEANEVTYVGLHVATDGITMLTNPANAAATCLTYQDIYALVGPESEGFESWSDANELAAELGAANAPYPDAPLAIVAPGEESGTYDTFVELVIAGIAEERGEGEFTRADYDASANDNVIVEGISGNDTSFGWVGFAFFEENQDVLKALEVDDGESGCVAPTAETIAAFEYPLSRPLFIYVKTNDLVDAPARAAYVDFYLSDEGLAAVAEAGYVELPAEAIAETRAAWEAAK